MSQIQTDFKELYRFSKELNRFADELEYQIKKLVNETNSVTAYSWQGRQADDFSALINDTERDLKKEIETLRELSIAIHEKARQLEAAAAVNFN
jgi:uncharacterized protein YukE